MAFPLESGPRGYSIDLDWPDVDLRSSAKGCQSDVPAPIVAGNTILNSNAVHYGGGLAVLNSGAVISANDMTADSVQSIDLVAGGNEVSYNERYGVEARMRPCSVFDNIVTDNSGVGILMLNWVKDDVIIDPVSGNSISGNITNRVAAIDVYCPGVIESNTIENNTGYDSGGVLADGSVTIKQNHCRQHR